MAKGLSEMHVLCASNCSPAEAPWLYSHPVEEYEEDILMQEAPKKRTESRWFPQKQLALAG